MKTKKKTRNAVIVLILCIALIIVLINGIYIPKEIIWIAIGYALCPISAYLYLKICEYYEKKKRGEKEKQDNVDQKEYKPKHAKK